jgi:hypothetical protein
VIARATLLCSWLLCVPAEAAEPADPVVCRTADDAFRVELEVAGAAALVDATDGCAIALRDSAPTRPIRLAISLGEPPPFGFPLDDRGAAVAWARRHGLFAARVAIDREIVLPWASGAVRAFVLRGDAPDGEPLREAVVARVGDGRADIVVAAWYDAYNRRKFAERAAALLGEVRITAGPTSPPPADGPRVALPSRPVEPIPAALGRPTPGSIQATPIRRSTGSPAGASPNKGPLPRSSASPRDQSAATNR